MPDSFGPVYEVTHIVDREIIGEFDVWLGRHIEEMLSIQGISRAASFTADDYEDGRPRRVSQYHFDSDTDLENYLAGPARAMRQSTDKEFAGRFDVYRRVLHETEVVDGSLRPAETCLNCGCKLSGQYCGDCGQRATTRLISIWQLLREAFGDLLELDSRLWRTLIPLAVRPGKLTRDYLEGRRARFMPPFRTYLVLSIIFFLIAFFDPREEFGILLGPETGMPDASEEAGEISSDTEEIRSDVISQVDQGGVGLTGQAGSGLPDDGAVPVVPAAEQGSPSNEVNDSDEDGDSFKVRFNNGHSTTTDNCDEIETDDWPPWLSAWLTPERLTVMCEKVVADEGQAWGSKLLDNVPAALIALLPLMALVLKALYPLSKRYYVEHVLFVVHYHAFIFLILSLLIMFARLATLLSLPEGISIITTVAVSLYMPVYLFKAMRRVYEQQWPLTAVKYLVLIMAYFIGLSGILGITAVIAAFSI
jgi:hypothetical protein